MKEIWNWIQLAIAAIGGGLGWFLGGFDGVLYTLVAFVVADYISGILRASYEKRLSSRIGAQGIVKKIGVFVMVGVAHLMDTHLLGGAAALRTAILFFYISNEGISVLENLSAVGLKIPRQLKDILAQLHGKSGSDNDTSDNGKKG